MGWEWPKFDLDGPENGLNKPTIDMNRKGLK